LGEWTTFAVGVGFRRYLNTKVKTFLLACSRLWLRASWVLLLALGLRASGALALCAREALRGLHQNKTLTRFFHHPAHLIQLLDIAWGIQYHQQ
jgi:hypothetical protein